MAALDTHSVLTKRQRALLNYWVTLCKDGGLPSRRKVNPVQLGGALANTSLVEKAGDRFRFRLTGSRLEGVFGRKVKGRVIDTMDRAIAEAGSASMDLALETSRPVSGCQMIGARYHCWLRVPLLDDDGHPTLVLCLDEFPSKAPDTAMRDVKISDSVTGSRSVA